MKYTIGETANLSGVSIPTLRYYDTIGLLKPESVQQENRYRYYSEQNITALLMIKQLRKLDFSLDMIQEIIHAGNPKLMQEKIEIRIEQLYAEQKQLQTKLAIAKDLKQILTEGNRLPAQQKLDEIAEREYPARYVITTRHNMTCIEKNYIQRYSELLGIAEEYQLHITGELSVKFYAKMYKLNRENADVEVSATVLENKSSCPFFKKEEKFSGISRLFRGSYINIQEGYAGMQEFVKTKGYEEEEYFMFRYLVNHAFTLAHENCVTDIILPIKK